MVNSFRVCLSGDDVFHSRPDAGEGGWEPPLERAAPERERFA